MKLTFLGGTDTGTGSRYLVESGSDRGLVECGMFQGLKELRLRNWAAFPVPPASIRWALLTHGHIDHSGWFPALVHGGFRGDIHCTPATADLLGILWRDAAHLQQEEADYANRHHTSRHSPALPLFTLDDAEDALRRLVAHAPGEDFRVGAFTARFRPVGHILGAASIRLDDGAASVLFSGDVGRPNDPLMLPPEPPMAADAVLVESTYGNRAHADEDPSERLAEIVRRVVARKGKLLIPAFAVGRAQQVLLLLHELGRRGAIPELPVYLNSPMAVEATELLGRHLGAHRLDADACDALVRSVHLARTVEESRALNELAGPLVVVSASGMATGGRVLHHLARWLPDADNAVLFAGFQAPGTRGDTLCSGTPEVKIFGRYVPVKAEILRLDSLSAHADAREIVAWLKAAPHLPRRVFLVHGEPAARDGLRRALRDFLSLEAILPRQGESFDVGGRG